MSLEKDMTRYEHLTGKSAEPITINRLCAYLDGVDRGIEELEKIKEKMEIIHDKYKINFQGNSMSVAKDCIEIINEGIADLKGERNE